MSSAASTIVVRVVGDRGLVQNLENVPDEMAYGTAEEAARRLMTIDSDEGRVEIEINGESVEPELIGYWRMLAREAIEYPDDFDRLVRSIDSFA
jgi:hypothetical protein